MAEQRRSVPGSRCARQRLANVSANQEATSLTLVGQPPTDTPLSTRPLLFQAPQSGKAGGQALRCEPGDVVDWTACISCSVSAAPLPSAITFHASLCAVSCPLIPSLGSAWPRRQLGGHLGKCMGGEVGIVLGRTVTKGPWPLE